MSKKSACEISRDAEYGHCDLDKANAIDKCNSNSDFTTAMNVGRYSRESAKHNYYDPVGRGILEKLLEAYLHEVGLAERVYGACLAQAKSKLYSCKEEVDKQLHECIKR